MSKSFLDFRKYEEHPEPGTPVEGYRIHYRTAEGNLYSPFMKEPSLTDLSPDEGLAINETGVNHSITDHGFYYWSARETAEEYMDLLVHRLFRGKIPEGELQLHKVRGTAVARDIHDIREGDLMDDMQLIDLVTS